ncbi:PREDICTED: uncharacterized protein LOC105149815 [Acromyrmex echinatior]|uniref:uncharacterized protein LOC105149815 n=1 Tax=Acromyrmex echinatior TaxID=103372 RepID=UPI000580D1C9|nr:PREDICTED: uncharacterized protein LOC105149815 [Acromyrmex echinatior]
MASFSPIVPRWHPRVNLGSSELSSTASYDSPLEPPMSNAKSKLERQPGAYLAPKLSLRWTSIFFRMYCQSRVGMIEAKTAPGGIPTHGLTLCHSTRTLAV